MLPAFRENWEIHVATTNALLAYAIANFTLAAAAFAFAIVTIVRDLVFTAGVGDRSQLLVDPGFDKNQICWYK